jgi:electron transfer flavoprotein alpha subunit
MTAIAGQDTSEVVRDGVVLVVAEHHAGVPRASALELLTAARALGPVHAVWLGEGGDDAAALLGQYGAGVVHTVPDLPEHLPPTAAELLTGLVAETGAVTVLLTSTFANKEVAARLALATGAGLVVDASSVDRGDGGRVVTTQQAFAASWTLRCAVTVPLAVVALKPNAVPAIPLEAPAPPEVRVHESPALVESVPDARVLVVERTPRPESGRPDLGEAQVVVVGGRGTEGDFSPVEDLADALGGAVGATRVATDEGWISHDTMVGQTGVSISPRLYVGAGVSGAIHHRGGMQASGTIVAVNDDPDAPIFEFADFGVVGDLFTVLPQAAAEIRRLRSQG